MAMASGNTVVFTMKFDPADLAKLASQITAALGGRNTPVPVAATAAPAAATGGTPSQQQQNQQSVFKSLVQFELMKKALDTIVRNSSVANSYLGAMGKVFGAAMDLLLIPFLPIFNLLLVGLAKLVEWLSRDDVQKALEKIGKWVMDRIGDFLKVVDKAVQMADKVIQWLEKHDVPGKIGDAAGKADDALGGVPSWIAKQIGSIAGPLVGANILAAIGTKIPFVSPIAKSFLGAESSIAKAGAGIATGGGGILGLLGNSVSLVSRLPQLGMAYGAIKAGIEGPKGSEGSLMNIIRGTGTMGGILPDWPSMIYRLAGSEDPAKFQQGSLQRNWWGGWEQNQPSQNVQVTINVHEATDGRKIADTVKDELGKLGKGLGFR